MDEIKFQQAKRWLEAYSRRFSDDASSPVFQVDVQLTCLLLSDANKTYCLRFCLNEDIWKVQFKSEKGDWCAYPNLSETRDWSEISDALEQAPLHVHWG